MVSTQPSSLPSGSTPSGSFSSASSTSTGLYPEEAWFCLSIFLVLVGLFQWGSILYSKLVAQRQPTKTVDEEATPTSSLAGTPSRSLARLPIALVNVFRVVAFRYTFEFGPYELKVVDIVLALAYVAFLVVWTLIVKEFAITKENVSTWAGRAGLLAASQFPLVTVLGTKNNLISLITGVGYDKLNFLHRVTARSCLALLFVHAGGEIYAASSVSSLFQPSWVRLGLMAVVSFSIVFIVSLRFIRTRVYEIFFYTHFVCVLIFLMGAYFHTKASQVAYWIWPSLMFWGLDRFMRLCRVLFCNHLYLGLGRRARWQDASTELLSNDFVRIRVRRPPHVEWSPGQTAYLILPSVSKFPLEAHPFSISSVDSDLFDPLASRRNRLGETARWKELVFVINVRGGFTKRLRDVAAQGATVPLWIDGPYGTAPEMAGYDTSIFVAGGSGVTFTLPVFLGAIESVRKQTSRCKRLVFIWSVRDPSHVLWISDMLYRAQALCPPGLTLSMRIFCTGDKAIDLDKALGESSEWAAMPPSVRIERGRPDLGGILRGEVNTAVGCVGVTVCGSQSLTRSVRRALVFPVSGFMSVWGGAPSVTLHVESFGYA